MNEKKLSVISLVLMLFTMVFGFNNIPRSFYLMGYAAIPWYIISAVLFFIPFAIINAEFGASYKNASGGLYTWMEESMGDKFAFIGIFMWYVSQVIFMISIALNVWVGVSYVLTGADKTSDFHPFGISTNFLFLILGIAWVIILTIMSRLGISWVKKATSIGGLAIALINLILLFAGIFIFVKNGFVFSERVTISAFLASPNPAYRNIISMLGFVVMALFAYAGIEAVAGFTDKMENAEKNFPKGLLLSAGLITAGYALGIFIIGIFVNWNSALSSERVHIGNAVYEIMRQLGVSIATTLGIDKNYEFGLFFVRFLGLSLVLSMFGSFVSYFYAPLKQLIEGTPAEFWPESFRKDPDKDVPTSALYDQSAVMVIMIVIIALTGGVGGKFFNNITMMMNTALTIPFVFISMAYIRFRKRKDLIKPFIIIKNESFARFAAISTIITVIVGNILQILDPITNFHKDAALMSAAERAMRMFDAYQNAAFMVASPFIFSILAIIIYRRGKRKSAGIKKA